MNNFNAWQGALSSVAGNALVQTLAFLPNLLGALIVFILGIILANWSKDLLIKSLGLVKFENLTQDSKIKQFLSKAEINQKLEVILGNMVKWIILLVFFVSATNILGLTTVANLLGGILAYVPNVISAVIVLALGVLLGGVVERVVKGALASVDLKTSRLMGKIASYTVVTIATLAAFSELKIAAGFVNILFIGFVAMLALGFGLAIGLGAKETVSKIMSDWYSELSRELKKK